MSEWKHPGDDEFLTDNEKRTDKPANDEERTLALAAHASPILAMIVSAGWLGFVAPFVIWYLNKDKSPFVRKAAAQSFNFNILTTAMSIAGWVCFFTVLLIPVAIILWICSFLLTVICHGLATYATYEGRDFNYPVQLDIIR